MSEREELELAERLSAELDLPLLDLDQCVFDPEALRAVPPAFAIARRLLPIATVEGALVVVMADPTDVSTIADVEHLTGKRTLKFTLQIAVAPKTDVERAIAKHLGPARPLS